MPDDQGPGNDNITGNRFDLQVGVKPDLGDLLSNLTVANKLLDDTEDKFRAISDIVGSMTQRLSQATRQSELLASQTNRIAQTYQSISSSSMALANVGGMAMGMPMGMGGMGGFMPGQMAFGGAPGYMPAMQPAMSGGGGGIFPAGAAPSEDIPEYGPPPPARTSRIPGVERVLAWEKIAGVGEKGGSTAGGVQGWINKFKTGAAAKGGGPISSFMKGANAPIGGARSMVPTVQQAVEAGVTDMGTLSALAEGGETAATAAGAAGLMGAGTEAGLLGGIGGAAAAAAPWVGAGYAAYKLWADSIAGSRRLTGVTGGTGVFNGVGGGYLPMKGTALFENLLHPGINYGEIQEKTLGAGYTGDSLQNAQDYMFQAYSRGLGDVVDQLDLYQEVVDKAGGSTQELTGAMDYMRDVAKTSNANLTALANNYKQNVESFVSMGLSGGTASSAALIQSTMMANSPLGALNPAVRNSGGYDLSNPLVRAGVTNQMGVPYNMMGTTAALNPAMGSALPVMAEKDIINRLRQFGFTEDMNARDVIQHFNDVGWGDYAADILSQMGITLQGIDSSSNTQDTADAIVAIMSNPAGTQYQGALDATKVHAFGGSTSVGYDSAGRQMTNYTTGQLGAEQHLAAYGFEDQDSPFTKTYEGFLAGGKESPVIEKLLGAGPDAVNNTYVRDKGGRITTLQQYMESDPNWAKKLSNPRSGVTIHTATAEEQTAIAGGNGQAPVSIDKAIGSSWETGVDLVNNTQASQNDTTTPGTGQTVQWDQAQFSQLITAIENIS